MAVITKQNMHMQEQHRHLLGIISGGGGGHSIVSDGQQELSRAHTPRALQRL